MGNARAHWEGNTLVVETTNFTNKTHMGYNNRYNSEKYKLVERFTPDLARPGWGGRSRFDDTETWTRPWTFTMPLTKDDRQPVFSRVPRGTSGWNTSCRRPVPKNARRADADRAHHARRAADDRQCARGRLADGRDRPAVVRSCFRRAEHVGNWSVPVGLQGGDVHVHQWLPD